LEEPRHPLLISGGRRLKRSGATSRARGRQRKQRQRQQRTQTHRPDIDAFLEELYQAEENGRSPHYSPERNGHSTTTSVPTMTRT